MISSRSGVMVWKEMNASRVVAPPKEAFGVMYWSILSSSMLVMLYVMLERWQTRVKISTKSPWHSAPPWPKSLKGAWPDWQPTRRSTAPLADVAMRVVMTSNKATAYVAALDLEVLEEEFNIYCFWLRLLFFLKKRDYKLVKRSVVCRKSERHYL